jgi:hypothetical protein
MNRYALKVWTLPFVNNLNANISLKNQYEYS